MQRWLRRLVLASLVVALGLAALPLARILPLVRDDLALDRVVVAVALDWRDFGMVKAQQRLQFEMDHRAIGQQVDERDCRLTETDDVRQVHCAWEMRVDLPLVSWDLPLSFASTARIDRGGVLLR